MVPNRVAVASAAVLVLAAAPAAASAPGRAAGVGAVRWHVVKTFTKHNTFLSDIVGLRGGAAWAGGQTPTGTPVLYHLTGKTWREVFLPGSIGTFVTDLSASSPGNVWAALANEPLVARLTPAGWVTKSFASGSDAIATSSVVTTGTKNTWVFAYDFTTKHPYAEHFDGSAWSTSPLPALVDCDCSTHAVSASSPDNIWAWVDDPKIKAFATMRFNGHKWRVIKLPSRLLPSGHTVGAEQILAESASNVWATATDNMAPKSIVLLHWNGLTWSKINGKLPKGQLAGPLAADGAGGLWLIARTPTFTDFILHFAHGRWTKYALPTSANGPVIPSALRLIGGTQTVLGVADLNPSIAGDKGAVAIEYGR